LLTLDFESSASAGSATSARKSQDRHDEAVLPHSQAQLATLCAHSLDFPTNAMVKPVNDVRHGAHPVENFAAIILIRSELRQRVVTQNEVGWLTGR
jgi:hypothetical protein